MGPIVLCFLTLMPWGGAFPIKVNAMMIESYRTLEECPTVIPEHCFPITVVDVGGMRLKVTDTVEQIDRKVEACKGRVTE